MNISPLLRIGTGLTLMATTCLACAGDFQIVSPNQADFNNISADLTATLNYKALAPAEEAGVLGFGVSGFASYTQTRDASSWQRLTGHDVDAVGMVGLRAYKGLPMGFSIGGLIATVPSTDAKLLGAQLRYAILPGGVATPAVSAGLSYTMVTGVDDFDFSSTGVDLSVSKGLTFVTPYAGVGYVHGVTDPDNRFGLDKESVDSLRAFVGARFSLGVLEITPEYERVGHNDAFNLRLGLSF